MRFLFKEIRSNDSVFDNPSTLVSVKTDLGLRVLPIRKRKKEEVRTMQQCYFIQVHNPSSYIVITKQHHRDLRLTRYLNPRGFLQDLRPKKKSTRNRS